MDPRARTTPQARHRVNDELYTLSERIASIRADIRTRTGMGEVLTLGHDTADPTVPNALFEDWPTFLALETAGLWDAVAEIAAAIDAIGDAYPNDD